MSINLNTGGLWKEAIPFVRPAGSWKQADAYVRQGGMWYQTTSQGLNILIDSATTLYDFNLKTWMEGAGLMPASGPVVINELRISARTVITHSPLPVRVPDITSDKSGAPPVYNAFNLVQVETANVPIHTGTVYRNNLFVYNQDLSKHAFTTGAGWPAGSVIKSLIVEGRIIGRGGDGSGLTGTAFSLTVRFPSGSSDSSVNINHAVSMRHGWPALETTLPITTLTVAGEVGGGGAGGCYPGVAWRVYLDTHSAEIIQDCQQGVAHFNSLSSTPSVYDLYRLQRPEFGLGDPLLGASGRRGNQIDTAPLHAAMISGSARSMAHGGGGGQGGGRGGISRKYSNTQTNTYVNGVNGGDGTLDTPGGAGTASVTFNTTDTKYGGAPSRVDGGGIPGSALGQDALSNLNVVVKSLDSVNTTGIFDAQPDSNFTEGSYTYLASNVIYSRGGNALTGASLVDNIVGTLKGRTV